MLLTIPTACADAADLSKRHGRAFGEWLNRGTGAFPGSEFETRAASVPENLRAAWLAAAAEEWLLAIGAGVVATDVPAFLQGVCLFGGVPVEKLASVRAAPAVIPLDRQPDGASARIWVVDDPKGKIVTAITPSLVGLNELFPDRDRYRVFVAGYDPTQLTGPSWQLGAVLVRDALRKEHAAALRGLASGWIVTGQVSQAEDGQPHQVVAVGIGAKAKLPLRKRDGSRNWLIPVENQRSSEEDFRELESLTAGRLHFARTVADAWNHVTGEGVIFAEDQPWPDDCEEVHGFVSNSQGPFLALILQTTPKRVVFWVSPEMMSLADELTRALAVACEFWRLAMPTVTPEKLPDATKHTSADLLAAAERALAACPSLTERRGPRILFNNTGGNFLHRMAAVRRAALNERIWLAYRDTNDGTPDFTLLRHHTGQMFTGRLVLDRDRLPLDWSGLVGHWRLSGSASKGGVKPSSEEQIAALVEVATRKSAPLPA